MKLIVCCSVILICLVQKCFAGGSTYCEPFETEINIIVANATVFISLYGEETISELTDILEDDTITSEEALDAINGDTHKIYKKFLDVYDETLVITKKIFDIWEQFHENPLDCARKYQDFIDFFECYNEEINELVCDIKEKFEIEN